MRMTATTSLGLLQLNTDILRLSDWCHNMYLDTYCRFRLMIAQKFISCWDYWTWTIKRSNFQLKMAHRIKINWKKGYKNTNFSFIKCRYVCQIYVWISYLKEKRETYLELHAFLKAQFCLFWSFYYARISIGKRILKCFEN